MGASPGSREEETWKSTIGRGNGAGGWPGEKE